MRDICQQDVEPDGLTFDVDGLTGEVIKEEADYAGVRVTFLGFLQNAFIPMQIDIGFGDVVEPAADLTDYPTIREFLVPLTEALVARQPFDMQWEPPGPWSERR